MSTHYKEIIHIFAHLFSFIWDMTHWNQLDIKNVMDQKQNKSADKYVAQSPSQLAYTHQLYVTID